MAVKITDTMLRMAEQAVEADDVASTGRGQSKVTLTRAADPVLLSGEE